MTNNLKLNVMTATEMVEEVKNKTGFFNEEEIINTLLSFLDVEISRNIAVKKSVKLTINYLKNN